MCRYNKFTFKRIFSCTLIFVSVFSLFERVCLWNLNLYSRAERRARSPMKTSKFPFHIIWLERRDTYESRLLRHEFLILKSCRFGVMSNSKMEHESHIHYCIISFAEKIIRRVRAELKCFVERSSSELALNIIMYIIWCMFTWSQHRMACTWVYTYNMYVLQT